MPLNLGAALKRSFVAAAAGTLTFKDVTSNNAGAAITIPAGAAEDGTEFVVLFDFARNTSSIVPTYVLPTDFTEIADFNFSSGVTKIRCVVSYKILTSGDAGASITGMDDTTEAKHLARYSFSSAISSITVGDYEEYGTNLNIASVTIGASSGASPLIAFGFASGSNAPSVSASWTPDFSDTQAGTGYATLLEALVMNSSPSDVTWDPDDVGSNNISITFYLEVA